MSPTPLKEDKLSTELLAKMTNGLQLHSLYSTRSPLVGADQRHSHSKQQRAFTPHVTVTRLA